MEFRAVHQQMNGLEWYFLWRYSLPEQVRRRRDEFYRITANRLPKRLQYWTYIVVGVEHIADDEIVPEVTYTTILQRFGRKIR